ncbi:MAG: methionyl-tRNA formyltransferase [Chloroflexi bacterium]|nr:methionyl-tRNA formyltransferase [Chloroflexota bacterium]
MRIVYFTYFGRIGSRVLEWMLANTNDEFLGVVSRPGEQGTAILDVAFKHYLPLYQPQVNVNDPVFLDLLRKLDPDIFISMYFGRLFGPEMLAIPKVGCLNMHPSLLPKYRGQGPSTWPIVNGETETGQTVHWLNEGIDAGDIIAQRAIPIAPDDTSRTLGKKLEDLGVELFTETWPLIASGKAPRIVQDDSQATYSVAPRREHSRIRWSMTAVQIHNMCRAFIDGGGAWARVGGKRLFIHKAQPYTGSLRVEGARPGQVLAILGLGVLVQAADGPVLLTSTSVGEDGPDLMTLLGQTLGNLPIVLG